MGKIFATCVISGLAKWGGGGEGLSFFNFQVISDPGYSKTNTKILVSALFQVKQTQQIWVKERKKKWKFYYFDAISGLVDTHSNINTEKGKTKQNFTIFGYFRSRTWK